MEPLDVYIQVGRLLARVSPRPASCKKTSRVSAAAKGSLPMIGRLLGHNHQNTTALYAHLADDPVDDLNATIGATIAEAIGLTTVSGWALKHRGARLSPSVRMGRSMSE